MSTNLSVPYLLHNVSVQSLRPSIIVHLAFSNEIVPVSLYLGTLVNNFFNLLNLTIRQSLVIICDMQSLNSYMAK